MRTRDPFPSRSLSPRLGSALKAELYEFPWSIRFLRLERSTGDVYRCTASLLNSKFAITAGHCCYSKINRQTGDWLPGYEATAQYGGHTASETQPVRVSHCFVPDLPGFAYKPGNKSTGNDIALIKFSTPLEIPVAPYRYNSICLPERSIKTEDVLLEAAGWGDVSDDDLDTLHKGHIMHKALNVTAQLQCKIKGGHSSGRLCVYLQPNQYTTTFCGVRGYFFKVLS